MASAVRKAETDAEPQIPLGLRYLRQLAQAEEAARIRAADAARKISR